MESLAQRKITRLSIIRTKNDTKKEERKTRELETVARRPFDGILDLDGEEGVHSQKGKGAHWGKYSSKLGFTH